MYDREKKSYDVWLNTLKHIVDNGVKRTIRGREVLEILNYQTKVDMAFPIMSLLNRKLGYRFMAAEALWILSGDNKVNTISPYSKKITDYSDDGIYYSGAYGPKIVDQLTYICDKLIEDQETRQAVLNIWRENPRNTKDMPCTLNYQLQIRENRLFATVNMRSSDIWMGWPYDIFNFTMLTTYIVAMLKERGIEWAHHLKTGHITLNAASQHLYIDDLEFARDVIANNVFELNAIEYKPLNMHSFTGCEDLKKHLRRFANKEKFKDGFMEELQQ